MENRGQKEPRSVRKSVGCISAVLGKKGISTIANPIPVIYSYNGEEKVRTVLCAPTPDGGLILGCMDPHESGWTVTNMGEIEFCNPEDVLNLFI